MRTLSTFLLAVFVFSCSSKNSILNKKEFAKVYLDSLSKKYPDITFQLNPDTSITAKKGDLDFKHFLDNIYIEYKADPDSIKEIISRYIAATIDLYNDKKEITLKNIVPVIKPTEYLEEINSLQKDGEKFPMLTEKYNDQLVIAYAEDSKNSIKFLTENDFKTLSISKDTLKAIALRNLVSILPDIKSEDDKGLFMLTAGGSYEASLILLSSIWTKENFPVDGDFIIAIPNRDMLLITGSKNKQGITKLRDISTDSYKNGNYQVSEYLFKWTGKRFEKFE